MCARGAIGGAAVGALIAACATTPAAEPEPATTTVASTQLDVASLMPRPARQRMAAAVTANRACEACHEREAASWRGSLHQRANVDDAYRAAFAREPLPFCRACHAPEAIATEEPPADVSALGVGCVTCHLTDDGRVLAAPTDEPTRDSDAHELVRSAPFAENAGCAHCHEFRFPTAFGSADGAMMQTTMREHRAFGEGSCVGCHMPDGAHGFGASRDPEMIEKAVTVVAERRGNAIHITLTPTRRGHAFPTGDLFRRLELSAESVGPDYMVLGADQRYLARHFEPRPHHVGRRLVRDDRVRDRPVTVILRPAAAEGRPIAWRVAYQRVAHPTGKDARRAEVEGEIELAAGMLPPRGAMTTGSQGERR